MSGTKEKPSSPIVVIIGPPGSGKTFMTSTIRSFYHQAPFLRYEEAYVEVRGDGPELYPEARVAVGSALYNEILTTRMLPRQYPIIIEAPFSSEDRCHTLLKRLIQQKPDIASSLYVIAIIPDLEVVNLSTVYRARALELVSQENLSALNIIRQLNQEFKTVEIPESVTKEELQAFTRMANPAEVHQIFKKIDSDFSDLNKGRTVTFDCVAKTTPQSKILGELLLSPHDYLHKEMEFLVNRAKAWSNDSHDIKWYRGYLYYFQALGLSLGTNSGGGAVRSSSSIERHNYSAVILKNSLIEGQKIIYDLRA